MPTKIRTFEDLISKETHGRLRQSVLMLSRYLFNQMHSIRNAPANK